MSYYESVFIVRQDVSATAAETLADKLAKILKTNGGAISKREYWGLIHLAYKIKKNKKAHYFLFNMDAPPQAVQEMERNMRLDEDVLRFLTLRIEELDETPSIVMQNRRLRDEERNPSRPSRPTESAPQETKSKTPGQTPDKTKTEEPTTDAKSPGNEKKASTEKTPPDSSEESATTENEGNEGAAEEDATKEASVHDESVEGAS
jgi:small subunit ribosomal protein S6